MAQHPFRPMFHQRLILRGGRLIPLDKAGRLAVTASGIGPKALVIVNTTLRPQIEPRLTRYITDLQAQGFDVVVEESEGGTPENLKALIISHETDLIGVALVGEQPAAWFEIENDFNPGHYASFPCDLFLMDLDGTWEDTDSNGKYDLHEAGSGDEAPEICIGRIAAHNMSGGEVAMLEHYFDTNHAYRTGVIQCAEKGLTYVEQDWANWPEANYGIARAYPDFDNMTPPELSEPDYLDRISNGLYEFVQLCAHSSSSGHSVGGGWVTTSEVQTAPPVATFYNLFACSSGRFTTANWLAGGYVYNTTGQGVTVIASSKTGSMTNFYEFYGPFGEGETFGESFRSYMEYLAPYSGSDRSWQFGLNIQGDPFAVEDPPAVPGDVDGNGVVNGLDLTAVIAAWQTTPGDPLWNPAADLDGSGVVDGADLTEVVSNWATASAAASAASESTETAKPGQRGSRPGYAGRDSGNERRK